MQDALECRSPSRCATCEHFAAGACALEAALASVLGPRPAPRIAVHGQTRPLLVTA